MQQPTQPQPPYHGLQWLVGEIDEPNRSICFRILEENRELFMTVPGSSRNHQAWKGGYWDHVLETMNCGHALYEFFSLMRPFTFSLSDALLVLFLHDIEKPWKYDLVNGELRIKSDLADKRAQHEFRTIKLKEYGIVLNHEQEIAMKYVEGEHMDYTPNMRMMTPLASLCHLADVMSARLWHDYPRRDDSWFGAKPVASAN